MLQGTTITASNRNRVRGSERLDERIASPAQRTQSRALSRDASAARGCARPGQPSRLPTTATQVVERVGHDAGTDAAGARAQPRQHEADDEQHGNADGLEVDRARTAAPSRSWPTAPPGSRARRPTWRTPRTRDRGSTAPRRAAPTTSATSANDDDHRGARRRCSTASPAAESKSPKNRSVQRRATPPRTRHASRRRAPQPRSERRNAKPRSIRTPLPCSFVVNQGQRPKPIHGSTALPSSSQRRRCAARPAAERRPSTRVGTKSDEQHRDGDVDEPPRGAAQRDAGRLRLGIRDRGARVGRPCQGR